MITMTIQFRFGRKTNSNFGESSQESKWMSILYHDYTESNNDLIEKTYWTKGKCGLTGWEKVWDALTNLVVWSAQSLTSQAQDWARS